MLRRALITGIVLTAFAVCFAVLARAFGGSFGVQATAMATIASAVPLLIVVPTFLWLDRYEAEPTRLLLFAFGWGALVAVIGALAVNTATIDFLYRAGVGDAEFTGPVLVAPIVEETAKGLGIVLVYRWGRREFDGIIDGIVYAGLVGAGFAFSENILYLSGAYLTYGDQGLHTLFFVRCVMGPFAHPLFTACIGIGLGVAAGSRSRIVRLVAIATGFVAAMLLHCFWNYSASLPGNGFLTMYAMVQFPLFLAFIALVVTFRYREARLIGRHLSPYADAGWLTYGEVRMLSNMTARRTARRWAQGVGGRPAARSMRTFQDAASELALLRGRMARGTAAADAQATERDLLETIAARRRDFAGAPVMTAS